MQYQDFVWRTALDARMLGSSFVSARSGLASKIAAALGVACVFMPFDLIPDRLPVVGYLDEAAYVIIGMAISFLLLPQHYRDEFKSRFAVGMGDLAHEPGSLAALWVRADSKQVRAAAVRLAILQGLALVVARPLLRLTMGRWPSDADVTAFRASFAHFAPVPPVLRALASVPGARHQLMRTMLISWMRADPTYREELKAELGSVTPASGDQLEVWLGRPVAFLHLEKTAGMSLASFLTARFHPLQIDPDPHRVCPPHVRAPFPPHVVERARRYPLVWGHYDLPSIRRLGDDRFVFTVLRKPEARILSLYWYWRSHGSLYLGRDGSNQPVLAAQTLSLTEFLDSEDPMVRNYIDNFYVRRLTGRYQTTANDDLLMQDTDGCLRAAMDALTSMNFVGITEDMNGSMAVLGGMLGFDPPARAPRVNITPRLSKEGTLSGEGPNAPITRRVAAQLAWLTRLDCLVYEAAYERFYGDATWRDFRRSQPQGGK